MEVLRDFAQSEPRSPLTRPSTLAPGAFEPAAAASARRILLSGLSSSNPLPPLTVRLLHGRLLRLDLLVDLSHLLLRALSSSGLHLHALSLHSLFPDPSDLTLPFALNSASRLPNPLPVGEQLHARSLKLPSHSNPYVLTSLLNLYGKCGLLDHARTLFDEMRCPCTVSWTALITAYMNAGCDREAVAIAREAFASGMRPDSFTAMRVLTACARAMDLDTGEVVWRAAEWDGIAGGVFVATAAVNLYVKCGEMAKAREVFDKMPEKDAVAWGAMVGGYISNGQPRETLEFFFAMQTQGLRPDCYTVADALSACTQLGWFDLGRQVVRVVDWNEFLDNPVLGTALLNMYAKCGTTWDAWSVFQQMRKRDIIVWNTMILGLGMTGHGKTAFALVGQMEKSGMKLNGNTFIGILCSCAHTGNVKDGRRYFHHMAQLVKDGWRYFHHMAQLYDITPQIEHYGCMVDLLSRAGLLQEAHQLINDMPVQANVVVWRALLGGCEVHRDAELAEHVLKQLILLEPLNSENYVMLSNIYSNSDRWEDVAKLRLDMKAKGVEKAPCPFRGQHTAWPLLQGVLVRADEELVRAAGRKPVLRTRVRRETSRLRQMVPVCAERAGAGGVENCYVFKSRLHEYTQKAGLVKPEYQTLKEGPSHEPIYKSTVVINNAKYQSLPGFFSRQAAEQSAAEVALMEIGKSLALPTTASIPAAQETGMCKRFLQQYAHKMKYAIASYICNKLAVAARTALHNNQGQSEGCANDTTKYIVVPGKWQGKMTEKRPFETPMVLHDEEARSVKQEPLMDTAMPQPQVEDRRGSSQSPPGLEVLLIARGEEQVRAAGRRPVLHTCAQRDSSRLRQVVPVCAERAGARGVENCYVFKSRLHEYTQKAGLVKPEYQTLKEGPSHEPIYKSTVVINNAKYQSLPGFFSRQAAEQSAAEVALMEIGKSLALPTNASIPAAQETGMCKIFLQQYAHKMKYAIASYICNQLAVAARTALLAIQGQSEGCANDTTKYIVVPGKRQR